MAQIYKYFLNWQAIPAKNIPFLEKEVHPFFGKRNGKFRGLRK